MTFSQLAPNGEEQPWEQRVLRTRDPAPTHRQGVAGGTAILLPGFPFCAILVPVSQPVVLAGSQQPAAGACWWLGSPPSSQGIWTFFLVLLGSLGSEPVGLLRNCLHRCHFPSLS